jgi:glycosyltransferase involved in cell wall biosynthesis
MSESEDERADLDVTILISTRDNARRLDLTLESLSRMQVPNGTSWEVVVADNGSSDPTAAVLDVWAGRIPLRRVLEPRPGVSRARNAALAIARGKLIVFTDDDVTVPAWWLTTYLNAYRAKGDQHFYGGPFDSELEGELPSGDWIRIAPASVRGLDWGDTPHQLEKGEYFTGANWAAPAHLVRRQGGFDVRMGPGGTSGPGGGEETDLMERLRRDGLTGWYLPDTRIQHWVPAAKTSPAHLLARWQTLAAVSAWKGRAWYGRYRVGRIPWRLYPELAVSALKSMAAKLGLVDRVEAAKQQAWARGAWIGFRLPPR